MIPKFYCSHCTYIAEGQLREFSSDSKKGINLPANFISQTYNFPDSMTTRRIKNKFVILCKSCDAPYKD